MALRIVAGLKAASRASRGLGRNLTVCSEKFWKIHQLDAPPRPKAASFPMANHKCCSPLGRAIQTPTHRDSAVLSCRTMEMRLKSEGGEGAKS